MLVVAVIGLNYLCRIKHRADGCFSDRSICRSNLGQVAIVVRGCQIIYGIRSQIPVQNRDVRDIDSIACVGVAWHAGPNDTGNVGSTKKTRVFNTAL